MVTALYANKTSVKVDVPDKVQKGQETTIVVHVSHKGNSKMHHTNWVVLSVNGKEVKKWEFHGSSLPPAENFTLEYKLTPNENLEISAQGNCNLHGSAGPDFQTVKIQ